MAAASTCTVQVDLTSTTPGVHVNTTEDLTSSLGNSGTAGATLEVDSGVPAIPTLNDWGLLILGSLLTLVTLWRMRVRA